MYWFCLNKCQNDFNDIYSYVYWFCLYKCQNDFNKILHSNTKYIYSILTFETKWRIITANPCPIVYDCYPDMIRTIWTGTLDVEGNTTIACHFTLLQSFLTIQCSILQIRHTFLVRNNSKIAFLRTNRIKANVRSIHNIYEGHIPPFGIW